MTANAKSIGAMILAAGESARMGRPKQLLEIEGRSLIQRAATAAIDAGCSPVVVVIGADETQVRGNLKGIPARIILNPDWRSGMGSSIRAGMRAIEPETCDIEAVVISVCDQPHLDSQVIRRLTDHWRQRGKSMAGCKYAADFGPPCCFARSQFASLGRMADEGGAKRLFLKNPADYTLLDWPPGAVDLDTIDDLASISVPGAVTFREKPC